MARSDELRVAVLGGVPPALGGGGLEIQAARTAEALRARGHDVRPVHEAPADWPFEVLHVFGHTADVGHLLHHWRRHPARLVVSPVLVVPRRREWRLRLGTRLPIPAFEPRVLRALVERADHLIALTRWEAGFLEGVGRARTAPIAVISNGVDADVPAASRERLCERLGAELPERYAIAVGAVSQRKRQAEVARALAGSRPLVVVGGWESGEDGRRAFAHAVDATGGTWLGEIADRELVHGLIAGADALVHLSEAEGQSLAVLEAIALGTPCVLSDLPQQRELAQRWPGAVEIVAGEAGVPAALARLSDRRAVTPPAARLAAGSAEVRSEPEVPTWDDVAAEVERVYDGLGGEPRLWSERG